MLVDGDVDDGSGPCPEWATAYEDAAKQATDRVAPPWGRSGDDLYMLYTGGTTGMPKGVMYRHADHASYVQGLGYRWLGLEPPTTVEDVPLEREFDPAVSEAMIVQSLAARLI